MHAHPNLSNVRLIKFQKHFFCSCTKSFAMSISDAEALFFYVVFEQRRYLKVLDSTELFCTKCICSLPCYGHFRILVNSFHKNLTASHNFCAAFYLQGRKFCN